jgi:hypothetical protein
MTNEELQKLNQIQNDITALQRSFDVVNEAPMEKNQISIKVSGYDHSIQTNRVPGLSDRLQIIAIEMMGEYLDELERQLNSLVLCTVEQGSPVYSPAKITDETK